MSEETLILYNTNTFCRFETKIYFFDFFLLFTRLITIFPEQVTEKTVGLWYKMQFFKQGNCRQWFLEYCISPSFKQNNETCQKTNAKV